MFVDEILRLYPPAPALAFRGRERAEIGGFAISKGSYLAIIPYVTHRHPAVWEEPERFDPERFGPERRRSMMPYPYVPFSTGRRTLHRQTFRVDGAQVSDRHDRPPDRSPLPCCQATR